MDLTTLKKCKAQNALGMAHRTRVASPDEARKAIRGTLEENREAFKRLAKYDLCVKKEAPRLLADTQKRKK